MNKPYRTRALTADEFAAVPAKPRAKKPKKPKPGRYTRRDERAQH